MTLIDSNIIIYSFTDEFSYLRKLFLEKGTFVSEISRVEVLGYHKLIEKEEAYFKDVFDFIPTITPNRVIFDKAIAFRKKYNMKLGDCLIAATVAVRNLTLITRNVRDFESITEIKWRNPFVSG